MNGFGFYCNTLRENELSEEFDGQDRYKFYLFKFTKTTNTRVKYTDTMHLRITSQIVRFPKRGMTPLKLFLIQIINCVLREYQTMSSRETSTVCTFRDTVLVFITTFLLRVS